MACHLHKLDCDAEANPKCALLAAVHVQAGGVIPQLEAPRVTCFSIEHLKHHTCCM